VAQDRIVLEKYAGYWNKAAIHFDKVVYLPIVDSTVRLANLKSGQLDFIERTAPADIAAISKDKRFKVSKIAEMGYQGIDFNVGNGEFAAKSPVRDARVREAFELAIDRKALVEVVMEEQADAGNQWVAPRSPWYAKNLPIPKPNVARARALLKEAGIPNPSFTLVTTTTSDAQRLAQVVQAMAKDAGFDIKIQAAEFATSLSMADKGQYEAYVLAWSGRADPDGNLFSFLACKQPNNYAGYCKPDVDALISKQRITVDADERRKLFEQIAANVLKDRPIVYLYHRHYLWTYTTRLSGLRIVPDGMVRLQGLKMS
jgi:peptide/nickel transport system substrate-binding protein